ncbi:acyltransferase family protein [Monashia sp. NPDC004114]
MRTRFAALDGLRFVGALMVLTTHVGFDSGAALRGPYAGLLSRLDAGVALFFAVSGFLLTRPHFMAHLEGHTRPRPRSYFVRRAARILPVLWLAVALAWWLLRTPSGATGDYLAHAALVQTYVGTPLTAGLTQFWSLSVEVSFYLVLPALAALMCRGSADLRWVRRVSAGLVLTMLAGPAWMAVATATGHAPWRLWLPGFLGWFAVGMLLALWHSARTVGLVRAGRVDAAAAYPGTVWAAAAAVIAIAGTALAGPYDLSEPTPGQAATKNFLYTVFGLLVILPAVAAVRGSAAPSGGRVLRSRPVVWLGVVSYGIFGYHVIVLALVGRIDAFEPFTGAFWGPWVITLVVTIALAALSYYVVELPVMGYARRRTSRSRPDVHASAPTSSAEALTPSQTSA